ncbi:hypothetical protein EPH95_01605 [Salicibibacter halophilus]|uniref:Uncharacterized protein n=1 Tax=Salicibibacter halophilus TaxID=2502791 RepID=A0A514LDV6_9BACI|nr:hypothetical protein [Salicibibacter halophilus]QDI90028.1 hypothetical protein EPH95_01605 [Salicibibacter halophilus]
MRVHSKARELCAAIQMRGWSNTRLSPNQHQGFVLNSRTGCRSWKGTKWGLISENTPERLTISVDMPRGHFDIEAAAEKLELDIISSDETTETSGVYLENKADRNTLHIFLCEEKLSKTVFNDSALVDLIGDIRRLNCL